MLVSLSVFFFFFAYLIYLSSPFFSFPPSRNSDPGSHMNTYELVQAYNPKFRQSRMPHAIGTRVSHTQYLVSCWPPWIGEEGDIASFLCWWPKAGASAEKLSRLISIKSYLTPKIESTLKPSTMRSRHFCTLPHKSPNVHAFRDRPWNFARVPCQALYECFIFFTRNLESLKTKISQNNTKTQLSGEKMTKRTFVKGSAWAH